MAFELRVANSRKQHVFPFLIRLAKSAFLLAALALPNFAQTFASGAARSATPPPQEQTTDPLGRSTPRGTVEAFIRAVHRDDFVAAARYMEIDDRQRPRTDELAYQLRELMNRYFNERLAAISDSPSGTVDDGLPLDRERVGPLKIGDERFDIILVRVKHPQAGEIWLISSETLSHVPAWYGAIQKSWIERVMPQLLLDYNFLGISLAQWVAWMASIGLPLLLSWLLFFAAMPLLRRTVADASLRRTIEVWQSALHWPLTLVVTLIAHVFALPYLGFSVGFRIVYVRCFGVLLVIAVTWSLKRISALCFARARVLMWHRGETETQSLMLLGQRVFGVLLTLAAVLSILRIVGVDTKTALTGVGIGGVAVALGAQKTVENLLGGIFLLTDKALAVGDVCCLSNRMGTIEDITLRSVRLRTLEQTLLSIPAGMLSQANIENFATRQKVLFQCNLLLRYGTTAEQLRVTLDAIRKLLVETPKVETATARVRLVNFGLRAIELELFAYVLTLDYTEFLAIREELLLHVAEVIENAGSGFARPTEFFYAEHYDANRKAQSLGKTAPTQTDGKGVVKLAS
jgi:MscS family membrane protein